ncbi:MAG: hypothetical protein Ct9H300mP4_09360 [Gammaproteobacteria bacterium]|nr:MAG: hypothetical protein Ct9H300mP4_09360 [Gammaproteobacteria bacterium]
MTIVLQGDVIQSIGESGSVTIDAQNDTTVDARGKFIIPGLWDAHVHLPLCTRTRLQDCL